MILISIVVAQTYPKISTKYHNKDHMMIDSTITDSIIADQKEIQRLLKQLLNK